MDHKTRIAELEPLRQELAGLKQPSNQERSALIYVTILQRHLQEAADFIDAEAKLAALAEAEALKLLEQKAGKAAPNQPTTPAS